MHAYWSHTKVGGAKPIFSLHASHLNEILVQIANHFEFFEEKKTKIERPPAIFVNASNFDQFAPENTKKNLVFVIFILVRHYAINPHNVFMIYPNKLIKDSFQYVCKAARLMRAKVDICFTYYFDCDSVCVTQPSGTHKL